MGENVESLSLFIRLSTRLVLLVRSDMRVVVLISIVDVRITIAAYGN